MSEDRCYRCPSTATHYPQVSYRGRVPSGPRAGEPANCRFMLRLPVCADHRAPFVEVVLRAAAVSPLSRLGEQFERHFLETQGFPPDLTRTRVAYFSRDSVEIVAWLKELADRREKMPAQDRTPPIHVTYCTFEELDAIMASAPDIAIKH